MSKYQLYINGHLADVKENENILFQKQRTDYTNPTIVKNSFTKTVKLPGTDNNNQIFNNIWKLDRVQWTNAFNASKRTPFVLFNNGNLVEKGYMKLDKIVWDGKFYNYETTLYGELGNILYQLSYNIDPDTEESTPMTLGDLNLGFSQIQISKDLIDYAWKRLQNDPSTQGDTYALFDTINFAVCYDGVPDCESFDPKKCWCSTTRLASVNWRDTLYGYNDFPDEVTVDGITYKYISSMLSRMDPDDHYGLMDLKKDVSPLECRDLRSYLLRPIVNISKVFDAIDTYLNINLGYSLDMSDPFFDSDKFKNTWMTLSMLYETNPNVESWTVFTAKELFSNTSSPASYLISYCKIYGIYIDVDLATKTVKLSRLPNFFQDKINTLVIDKGKEVKINPLSFDKASYTFDMGEGEGEFLKKYKDTYNIQYGSMKVNTGYRFDSETSPYIDNNVFREGVDSLDQSIYYKYPVTILGANLIDYPFALVDNTNLPTYKLFKVVGSDIDTTQDLSGEMKLVDYLAGSSPQYSITFSGYQFMDDRWFGIRSGVYQDGFPKLQLHTDDNKAADGKDVLLVYNGFKQVQYGKQTSKYSNMFKRESKSGFEYVNYLLSDDISILKQVTGKNCYYDNPQPQEGYGYNYIKIINKLPSFTRCDYTVNFDGENTPIMMTNNFSSYNITGSDGTVTINTSYDDYFKTTIS